MGDVCADAHARLPPRARRQGLRSQELPAARVARRAGHKDCTRTSCPSCCQRCMRSCCQRCMRHDLAGWKTCAQTHARLPSLSGGPCSCGPAALRVCFVLSCCHRCMRHDLAPPMSAAVPAAALAAATREVALEAWRWRLGAGGLVALEACARWRRVGEVVTIWGVRAVAHWWPCPRGPVAVRRRALGAMLQCVSILALLVAWRGAWLGECRLWVPWA